MHGLIAIPLTLIFDAKTTSTFYFLRECEQYSHEIKNKQQPKYKDHVFDFVIPAFVANITEWIKWAFLS